MYPVIPAEMVNGAVQLAVYFVTALAALLSLLLTARA